MKVLVVAFTFPPNKDGVANATAMMVEGFLTRGWDITVLTEETSPKRDSLDWNGARLTEFRYRPPEDGVIEILGMDESYAEYLAKGWDHIIFHTYVEPLRYSLPLLNSISSSKTIVSHGYGALVWQPAEKFPFGFGQVILGFRDSLRMSRWIKRFDRVVYLSRKADMLGFYDHLIAKLTGYAGRRVIPNGIDLNEHGEDPAGFRKLHGIAPDAFVFLCVANYSPRKDQGYAARAFRQAAIPGSVLVFIGSELNEHSVKFQQADEASSHDSAGNILWLERQDRKSTLDAITACDAFVLSARHEAQPIAILEAMRESKPWIARRAGCIDIMEGGICTRSVNAMARAMRRLSGDAGLAKKLGMQGSAAVVTHYNKSGYINSYCELLEELSASRKKSQTGASQGKH